MKAIVIQEDRTAAVKDVQKPSLRARYIRIKVVAVAINPSKYLLRTRIKVLNVPS